MIDTQNFEQNVEEIVYKILKKEGICPDYALQSTLIPDEVVLTESELEYMEDKQCLVWLGSNESGAKQGVKCNQLYISNRGSMRVDKTLPISFEEAFDIWEAYFKGHSLEDIYFTVIFNEENVGLSDIRLVVWSLLHGKCNYALDFIREDRYTFDFKKYLGRF